MILSAEVISFLPKLNASLNGMATCLLLAGYVAIKKQNRDLHKKLMVGAFIISSLFLTSYLLYHGQVGSKYFPDLGWIKTLYRVILVPHILLAALMLPLILRTFYLAFKEDWTGHKKVAKVCFPVWLYVSFSGVIIYFMLYEWFT